MPRPRILLADDHAETAELLSMVLRPQFDVLPGVRDGNSLVCAAEQLHPDVIVADISMPGLDGISAAKVIRLRDPRARIVFVTMHSDPTLVKQGLATGALGYVLKFSAGDELVPAIRAALAGRQYVSPALDSPGLSSMLEH